MDNLSKLITVVSILDCSKTKLHYQRNLTIMKIYPKLNERRISIKEAREGLYAGGEWVQINVSKARSSRATACHKQQWRPKSIQLNNAEPSLFACKS